MRLSANTVMIMRGGGLASQPASTALCQKVQARKMQCSAVQCSNVHYNAVQGAIPRVSETDTTNHLAGHTAKARWTFCRWTC